MIPLTPARQYVNAGMSSIYKPKPWPVVSRAAIGKAVVVQKQEPLSEDDLREQAILKASADMENAWAMWELTERMSDYLEARRLLCERDELVRGRSAAQIARMEAAKGLA